MPYGLPDSWVTWGSRRAGRKIFKPPRGGRKLPPIKIGGSGPTRTKTVYKYKFSHMSWNRYALNYYKEFHTKSGYLWKYLDRQGVIAVQAAKRRIGKIPQKPWRTGRLAKSIHKKHLGYTNKTGQYVAIGSWTVPYALMVHRGTRPHKILPRNGNQLVFMAKGARGMRLVRTPEVNHPGARRNRYLYDQLKFFRGAGKTPMYIPNYIERAKHRIK